MPPVPAALTPTIPTGPSVSISFDHDAPSASHSPSSSAHQSSSVHHGVATDHILFKVIQLSATNHDPFVNEFAPDTVTLNHQLLPISTIQTPATDALVVAFYNSVLTSMGRVEKNKARLVAKGNIRQEEVSYDCKSILRPAGSPDLKLSEYFFPCQFSSKNMSFLSNGREKNCILQWDLKEEV
ncbi:hypothetical protein Tco_0218544 [Tanacetum coccineum]